MNRHISGSTLRAAVAGIFVAAAAFALPAQATPSFETFGSLPAFNPGSGIPNDAFAISTATTGDTTITIGLSATQRFANPALTNDGAGTFFAGTGSNFGIPSNPADQSSSSTLGATWNFNFFVGLVGGALTSNDFDIILTYDTDPAVGNGGRGTINLGAATALLVNPAGETEIEGSENLLFGSLAVDFLTIVNAPDVAFNPNVGGTYEFALSIADLQGGPLASVAIDVVVETPEPGALALFGLGLVGYGLIRRRRAAS